VPSNLVMLRLGHRPWLTLLIVGWGAVAACFALARSPWSLYLLRLLLGALEAGAQPALWHVYTLFFPRKQ
jgi:ACS family 4-hydroxyphenylacetate permease-like MFS transporter